MLLCAARFFVVWRDEEHNSDVHQRSSGEHRLTGDDAEDTGHCLSKQGYNVAVLGARFIRETDENCKCSSGGPLIAVQKNVSCVLDGKGRQVEIVVEKHFELQRF